MADGDDPLPARRTGGRSARVHKAVLEATMDVLQKSGFAALSIRDVAARAGVHESSVYRRWGTKSDLVLDSLLSRARGQVPVPNTGSLRKDLLVMLSAFADNLRTPMGENLMRMLVRNDRQGLEDVRERYLRDRYTQFSAIFDRAERRGELRPGVDRFLTIETLIGPLYVRFLITREPLNTGVLEYVVDLVLPGISAG
jgi:AcrR family transcriptional regulator